MKLDTPVVRLIVLIADSLVCFGPFYLYDTLVSSQPLLLGAPCNSSDADASPARNCCRECLGYNPLEYNLLLGLPIGLSAGAGLLAGYIIDRFGFRTFTLITACCPIAGAVLRAVAIRPGLPHALMLAGGVVVDNVFTVLCIIRIYICTRWFRGPTLGFAVGLTMSVSMCGSILAYYMNVPLARLIGFEAMFWCAVPIAGSALVFAAIIVCMDVVSQDAERSLDRKQGPAFSLASVRRFPWRFWAVCLVIALAWLLFYAFLGNSVSIQTDIFQVDVEFASFSTGLMYIVNIAVPPLAGTLATRCGLAGLLVVLGCLANLAGFALIVWPAAEPLVCVFAISLAFATAYPVLSSVLADLVDEGSLASANGIMNCAICCAIALGDAVVGVIANGGRTRRQGWERSGLFLMGVAGLQSAVVVGLMVADAVCEEKILSRRGGQRAAAEEETQLLLKESGERSGRSLESSFRGPM